MQIVDFFYKKKTLLAGVIGFVFGCATGISGFLDALNKIPEFYTQIKKNYLYESSFLKGDWSTNGEYVANSGDLGLNITQPVMVMSMEPGVDGSIVGEIMSEKICDALPLTWSINFMSDSPSIANFFMDRKFIITQLHNGYTETVATLKLASENKELGVITFRVVSDSTGSLPPQIIFGKNLPEYKNDYKKIQEYCGDSPRKFWSQQLGKEIPKPQILH